MSKIFEKLNSNWESLLKTMKEDFEISDHIYNTFIYNILKPIKIEKNTLFIEVPEIGYISYINNRLLSPLRITISQAINIPLDDLEIIISCKNSKQKEKNDEEEINLKLKLSSIYEPENTFDNFVQGSSNAFAYASAIAVSENPGENYNPLFIYSKTGLGKTHLLHAIAINALKNNINLNILFTTCENFTNEFINSIRTKKTSEFKNKYRKVDILLIDDIHFLKDKPETQEEFFNTFNELKDNKKQIVMTSDKPIKELEGIEERLISRFGSGIICDIQLPDYETRLAIIRKKLENRNPEYPVDNEVMKYIAQTVKSNIRDLEGSLSNIILYSKLIKKSLNLNLAKEILSNIKDKEKKKLTPEKITEIICDYFNVNMLDICGPKRNREYVYARDIAIYICRDQIKDITQEKIGSFFGGRDHSTVINSCAKIESKMKTDKELVENIKNIKELLLN